MLRMQVTIELTPSDVVDIVAELLTETQVPYLDESAQLAAALRLWPTQRELLVAVRGQLTRPSEHDWVQHQDPATWNVALRLAKRRFQTLFKGVDLVPLSIP